MLAHLALFVGVQFSPALVQGRLVAHTIVQVLHVSWLRRAKHLLAAFPSSMWFHPGGGSNPPSLHGCWAPIPSDGGSDPPCRYRSRSHDCWVPIPIYGGSDPPCRCRSRAQGYWVPIPFLNRDEKQEARFRSSSWAPIPGHPARMHPSRISQRSLRLSRTPQ